MERIAVHVDNHSQERQLGSYSYDIKWKQQEWMDYIVSEDNSAILKVVVHSDRHCRHGWKQQLDTRYPPRPRPIPSTARGAATIKQEFEFRNNGHRQAMYIRWSGAGSSG